MSTPDPHPWTRIAARAGTNALQLATVPLVVIGTATLTGGLDAAPEAVRTAAGLAAPPLLLLFLFGLAASYLPRPASEDVAALASPIRGRCRAVNSPADQVPSHGVHAFAQTYAIDLLHEPAGGERPIFGGRRAMRRPEEYPSFGRPVYAPATGRVVRVVDRARDHRCRSNWLGYLYMAVEGVVLQLRGTRGLLGNHVVIALDDGGHVALAHLRRGSVSVQEGDGVQRGEVVAEVGNSGNSSEPHIHLQLMDRPKPTTAVGLPFALDDVAVSEEARAADRADPPLAPGAATVFHAGVTQAQH